MLARGHGKQSRYGDLSDDFSVQHGKVTYHRDSNVPCPVSCIAVALVFPLTVRAKECIFMATAKRCPYRI